MAVLDRKFGFQAGISSITNIFCSAEIYDATVSGLMVVLLLAATSFAMAVLAV